MQKYKKREIIWNGVDAQVMIPYDYMHEVWILKHAS